MTAVQHPAENLVWYQLPAAAAGQPGAGPAVGRGAGEAERG
jgi:hypothetical protein